MTLSGIATVLALGAAGLGIVLALRGAGRSVKVRPMLEFVRIALGVGGVAALAVIGGVTTEPAVAAVAIICGGALGFAQGRGVEVTVREGVRYATRSPFGIAVYLASLAATQLAGLVNRTDAVRLGQAVALGGVAVVAGLVAGRESGPSAPTDSRLPGRVATGLVVLAIGGGAVLGPLVDSGAAQDISLCDLLPSVPELTVSAQSETGCQLGRGPDREIMYALVIRVASPDEARTQFSNNVASTWMPLDLGDASGRLDSYNDRAGNYDVSYFWIRANLMALLTVYDVADPSEADVVARAMDDRMAVFSSGFAATGDDPEAAPCSMDGEGNCITDDAPTEDALVERDDGDDGAGEEAPGEARDEDEITDEEATAQAVATVLVALSMGAISVLEATEMLTELLPGRPDVVESLLGTSLPQPGTSDAAPTTVFEGLEKSPPGRSIPPDSVLIDLDGDGRPDGAIWDDDGDGQADMLGRDPDGDGFTDPIPAESVPQSTFEPVDPKGPPGSQPPREEFGPRDTTGDGQPDSARMDLDGDGDAETTFKDEDGDGVADRMEVDADGDGVPESTEWADGRQTTEAVSEPGEVGMGEREPGGEAGDPSTAGTEPEETSSGQEPGSGEDGSVEQHDGGEGDDAGAQGGAELPGLQVSEQEIADIYERGLAGGRSLDDLREDVAGLDRARGGTGDVGNPLGLEMQPTDRGDLPLTVGELADYRRAQRELSGLLAQRGRLDQEWQGHLERFAQWRERNPVQAALDVWDAETSFQERIDQHEAWIDTWKEWERGNRWRTAPDGSSFNEWHHSAESSGGDNLGVDEIARHRRAIDSIERSRVDYMEAARDRPSASEEGRALDAAQRELLDSRRALAGEINAARAKVERYHSYGAGRPLPAL